MTATRDTTKAGFEGRGQDSAGAPRDRAQRDIVALGIATAAILLFIATGGAVMPKAIRAFAGVGNGTDPLLMTALLLNIALIIFSWRRYRELTGEIDERRRAEAQARELAQRDPLTGCLNRRAMTEVTEALRTRTSERGQAIAYGMIDLDNFKQVNDMHGHKAGDQVLVQFAERVRDVLPKSARFARLGGDEFAFIVPFDPTRRERIDDLVIRLYEGMALPFRLDKVALELTMSVGLASDHCNNGLEPLTATGETLLHRADIAMYQAKKQGKNRFFWFEPTMENELRFRNELEIGIRRGLGKGEFVPFYEQQIDLETGELVGFEMLARWRSPSLGLVSPEIFIPVAEEMGLIAELSEQLMRQAFTDARAWDEELTLSINISPLQLRDPWFAQKLLKLLVEYNFPPHRLEIEITESCLHENIGLVRSMITSLRNQGVRVSLDDFGTGYSSLEQLRSLPFDRLKIDRSFIKDLAENGGKSRIVDAIVSLGRGLDMPITAEGIEHEDILAALRRMGDFKGQGYLYGRPETAEEVRQRLGLAGRLAGREMTLSPGMARAVELPDLAALASGAARPVRDEDGEPGTIHRHPGGTALDGGPILPRRNRG
ncbi:bifunctional diguanylate cyclase/phosphodiesterase [Erythrobacter sp. HL-111]|uniref:putative bifunctional diguanylate cyclase/phosphodiesterase n=1 Tax=Erythrobacter sp. HL-111 TaxID=1798193 RepID=UPI0006D9E87C|nr:EAL domain-containing protein [Erythrobacter sp. HL-111]KPP96190.1 MAG: diguanylate cyclase/phosphodiesterase [Erythrobacteraceae bacterium HL-111]SDR78704.1 diguanylate cyclase/phosphodiesterase [Erythrobacter sp. HL-111]